MLSGRAFSHFAAARKSSIILGRSSWPAFEQALEAAGVSYRRYLYPGTQHGFHNDTTPRYDEAAAKEAWQHTLDWFNKYLRTGAA